ncbi:RTA1-domain-containing protein [Hypoxylon fragiforme]|uniref:RTA1-domain-containing protein n=1 Tax=Hypoxylon fragiforme TaxID=63214 RepID=UPI0020C5F3E3|nr:RTA1-domain-containing protein [Hypoxylon fragiforme]KAI2612487.1 RTA1-domain-containing protein [Hypoxylon fragiforme]
MASKLRNASFYDYDPSSPVAAVYCALFGLAFIWSGYMTLLEVVGYADRILSANDPGNLNFILAPVLMAGAIYVVPAHERTTRLLWIPPRWVTPIFVAFDVVSLIIQLIGTARTSRSPRGLALQIGAFGVFTVVAARFYFTSRRFEEGRQSRGLDEVDVGNRGIFRKGSSQNINPSWRRLLHVINASCVMILVRSVFRVVEFAEGGHGTVMQHEYLSYLPFMGFSVPKHPVVTAELGSEDGSATAPREI